ncbi:N-methyl-L-tryptophan oxidase [Cedecea davisae]|uniref:N-methyl-L-tryptophan oxidase n=1 Tax=Cedecea davisae TaxID=158484 RepID=UPI00242BD969|nr:N-methyl-L-tryptophan oxidase [Cedecea davisae]
MNYDLIIVGSGSVGAAAGCYATHSGLKVLMIDSGHPPHDQGSHHGDTRLIRHAYGEGEKYVPMVLRAQKLWDALAETSGEKLFHRTGVINLGPADSAFIRNVAASAEKFSLPLETLDSAAVTARWPEIVVPENYVGLFEPNSGVLKSEIAVETYISLAKQGGCAQLFNCRVNDIHHGEEGVTVVTEEGEYHGSKLLLSAGTWVSKLLPELPVTPVRKIFAWHQADGRYSENNKFPAFTAETPNGDQYYGFPAEDNELKLGKHNGGQNIDSHEQRKPFGAFASDGSEVFPFLREFLPGIGCCLHGKACSYDNSPDEDFIIDTLPGHDNTLVITGLSGHGFKFASVLGEIACQFALGQKPAFDLSPFALSRFKTA